MRLPLVRTLLRRTALVVTAATTAACSDQAPPPPAALVAVGEFQFTGTVAERIPSALTVRVNDAQGSPVNGVPVTFTVADGGGSVTKLVDTTRSGGLASTNWTLGERSGAQRLTAGAVGLTSVEFTAAARAAAPATIAANGGNGQSVVVGTAVLTAPAVIVKDRFTNPVPGVTVLFSIASGGGTTSTNAVSTNSSGIAAASEWKLGTAVGTNTMTALALASGIAGNPVTFTATATAGAAARLGAVGSTSLSGIVFKSQTPVPQVKVTDVDGNPVAGTAVTFTGSTGSTVSGSSKTTDPAGLASPDGWILGTAAGSYTLTATASGLAAAIVTAVARADVPTSMTIVVGNTQTSPAGRPVAVEPTVKVTDMHGNPVSGIDIIFEVASGGGAAVGRRATTNALGLATVGGWTLGDAVGANTLVASVQTSGLAVPSVTFTATAAAGAAATMTAGAGQSQTAVAGAAVGAAPTVVVRDARGNPVAGVVVTFLVTSGGGSTTRASDTTLATGVATAGSWVLGGTVGPQTLVARSTNLPDVTFTATATAGAAARLSAFSTQAQSGVSVGTALTLSQRPAVRVTDTEGNPVSGVPVAFSVDADGYSGFLTGGSTTTTVLTNSNGIATVGAWTMPTAVGTATAVATVSGIAETVTFSVTTSFGAISRLRITANSSSTLLVTAGGTASVITISALDAFGNVVTSYNGAKSVTFSGASAAPGGTIPTANGVDFGTASELTFLNGVATTALRLYRAQSASVSVSDGTNSSGVTGALSATVRAAAESAIVRETPSSAAQSISGVLARSVTVKLVDVYGNGIAGVDVTVVASHGSLASPTGTTASNGTVTFSWTNALSTTAVSQTLSFNTETISGTLLYTYTVSP